MPFWTSWPRSLTCDLDLQRHSRGAADTSAENPIFCSRSPLFGTNPFGGYRDFIHHQKTRLTAPKTTFCTSLRVVTKADENKSCLLLIVYLADFQPSLKSPFVYCTTHGSIPQARTHFPRVFPDFCSFFPYFSLTTFKFPDFYIFSRLVATLNIFC